MFKLFSEKRSVCFSAFVVFGLLLGLNASAGIVTVTWPCTNSSRVNTSVKNSPSKGSSNSSNVIVNNQSSANIFVKDYTGPVAVSEAIAAFWPSTDGGTTYTAWANETDEVSTRYIEFSVTPQAGQKINFTSLSFYIAGIATGYLRANVYYSTDNFATRTLCNTNGLPVLPQISTAADLLLCSTSLNSTVSYGQKLSIRIYPWFMRSSSSAKSIVLGNVVLGGNDFADVITVPQVSTTEVTKISSSTALSGVAISSNGGASVIQSGICWDTVPNPTINGQFGTMNGPGGTVFENELTYLQGATTYYVRAYATNSVGTAYGNQISFKTGSLPAFPGAEGFGKSTIGGRGGRVVEVTNLNDAGTGSLRYALETVTEPRTVVFRVAGTIDLQSPLTIKSPYITIAGQTAPGGGICIKNYPLYVQADQVIIRYIRCRLGDAVVGDNDAISLMGSKNLMLDHCSFSWSIDCVADFTDSNGQCTMQWCIISEALASENHSKGSHSMGGAWDGLYGGTYHHNLITNTNSRIPRIDAAKGPDMFGKETRDLVDVYNNVIYNWGNGLAYGGENADVNYRSNFIKYGPATNNADKYTIFGPSGYCKLFVSGNYVYGSTANTADNTKGVTLSGTSWLPTSSLYNITPFKVVDGNIESAISAYDNVLKYSGANFPLRDAVDTRIVNEVKTNGGKIIVSQTEVGGWPVLASGTAPTDTDKDGMPDTWETEKGLNPNYAADRNNMDSMGYTMLESYLNGLTSGSFPTAVVTPLSNSDTDIKMYLFWKNNQVYLNYQLDELADIHITAYDMSGKVITNQRDVKQAPGSYSKQINVTGFNYGFAGLVRLDVSSLSGNSVTKCLKIIR